MRNLTLTNAALPFQPLLSEFRDYALGIGEKPLALTPCRDVTSFVASQRRKAALIPRRRGRRGMHPLSSMATGPPAEVSSAPQPGSARRGILFTSSLWNSNPPNLCCFTLGTEQNSKCQKDVRCADRWCNDHWNASTDLKLKGCT